MPASPCAPSLWRAAPPAISHFPAINAICPGISAYSPSGLDHQLQGGPRLRIPYAPLGRSRELSVSQVSERRHTKDMEGAMEGKKGHQEGAIQSLGQVSQFSCTSSFSSGCYSADASQDRRRRSVTSSSANSPLARWQSVLPN